MKIVRIVFFMIITFGLLSCSTGSDNSCPQISLLRSDLNVIALGDTTFINCQANDEENDVLTYSWYLDNQPLSINQPTFSWIADSSIGLKEIRCRVTDSHDNTKEKSLYIKVTDSYENIYDIAVDDASTPELSDIINQLTPIRSNSNQLIWDGVPGVSRILVSTYTKYPSSYQSSIGDTMSLVWGTTWITVGNELKLKIDKSIVTENRLDLRIRQVLGLPPTNQNQYIVEMWVYPIDLFRPAKDPEIDDAVCQLTFPANVSQSHINWFNANVASSYGEDGYPWTQLGYTYDWGNSISKTGLSEYCIRQNSNVRIKSVTIVKDYFEPI